jgi:hypothetical protein
MDDASIKFLKQLSRWLLHNLGAGLGNFRGDLGDQRAGKFIRCGGIRAGKL